MLALTAEGSQRFGEVYLVILLVNVAGVIALLVLIGSRLADFVRDWRKHVPGSRLRGRTLLMLLGKVKAALGSDKTTEAGEINVEVNKGIVQLNGFVDTAKEKAQAGTVAKGVEGVKQVENNLIVKTASASTGQSIDDSGITSKVNTALVKSEQTKAGDIKVQTESGVVQLSGFVDSQAQKDAAGKVAQSVAGVKSVKNNLRVKGT